MSDPVPDDVFALLRLNADAALMKLIEAVTVACPGPHAPVQHRDMKPPWCAVCGRTARGLMVREPQS